MERKINLSADTVFHTIQGEGERTGLASTFIRLNDCNLSCGFCDTKFTWYEKDPDYGKNREVSLVELINMVESEQAKKQAKSNRLVITGGEPFLQQGVIATLLENTDYIAEIESNGTIMPKTALLRQILENKALLNISPKTSNSGQELYKLYTKRLPYFNTLPNVTFKFVVSSEQDLLEVVDYYMPLIDGSKVIVMPEGDTLEKTTQTARNIVNSCIKHNLRIMPRTHQLLFKENRRV